MPLLGTGRANGGNAASIGKPRPEADWQRCARVSMKSAASAGRFSRSGSAPRSRPAVRSRFIAMRSRTSPGARQRKVGPSTPCGRFQILRLRG